MEADDYKYLLQKYFVSFGDDDLLRRPSEDDLSMFVVSAVRWLTYSSTRTSLRTPTQIHDILTRMSAAANALLILEDAHNVDDFIWLEQIWHNRDYFAVPRHIFRFRQLVHTFQRLFEEDKLDRRSRGMLHECLMHVHRDREGSSDLPSPHWQQDPCHSGCDWSSHSGCAVCHDNMEAQCSLLKPSAPLRAQEKPLFANMLMTPSPRPVLRGVPVPDL